MANSRQTTVFEFEALGIGTKYKLRFHEYLPEGIAKFDATSPELSIEEASRERAYIQTSLHCNELPGMLVCNHLIKLLDVAAATGRVLKPITIVPYANPIGLHQIFLGFHFGRFSMSTGVNFNRSWPDLSAQVAQEVKDNLIPGDALHNTAIIRQALYRATCAWSTNDVENLLKKELYKRASISSVVLDLHCDMDAVLHMYTHDELWPALQDLADSIESRCNMVCADSGGNAFDESCSEVWNKVRSKISSTLPDFPADTIKSSIPMACQSATIELRGQSDVYDDLAIRDAANLFAFLVRRGFIANDPASPIPPLVSPSSSVAVPLTGVDFIEATVPGVFAWRVKPGDTVIEGQLLGEIVNIEEVDAPRTPIIARNAGFVFGMEVHKLAIPGEIAVYVSGSVPLEWRKGYLLTA